MTDIFLDALTNMELMRNAARSIHKQAAALEANEPTRASLTVGEATSFLVALSYRVTLPKPRLARQERPTLNCLGKPISPLFDPNYKVKHKTSYAHLFKPYGYAMKLTQWDNV